MVKMYIGNKLIEDIGAPVLSLDDVIGMAWVLTRTRRFNGNPSAFTVGEHMGLCEEIAEKTGQSEAVIDWAAVHDLHEGALGDTIAPVKQYIQSDRLRELERVWDIAIADAMEIERPTAETYHAVHKIDLIARRIEMEHMGIEPDDALPPVPDGLCVLALLRASGVVLK